MVSTLVRFESCEFLPVGTPENLCVCSSVDNEEALRHRIVDVCQTIRNDPVSLNGCGGP
jgi:hypothetical protein